MPLRITLKPHERVFINGAVVVNGDNRSDITVMNDVPILRQKDILTERDAVTPCQRVYLAVQMMYMDPVQLAAHRELYWKLSRDVTQAAPSTTRYMDAISGHVAAGQYYHALRAARQLIQYEKELLAHVLKPA